MKVEEFIKLLPELSSRNASFRPHKYILLLSLIDIIQSQEHPVNQFFYDEEIKSRFSDYLYRFGKQNDRNRPYTPFFHLKSSGFWKLKAKRDKEQVLQSLSSIGGPGDIIENVDFGYFTDEVFKLLSDPESAAKIKDFIISHIKDQQIKRSSQVKETQGQYLSESLFEHENKALKKIEDGIRQYGLLINNVCLYDNQSRLYFEYDIILVTSFRVFVVELKHWSGHIQIAPNNWIFNKTRYRPDPHRNNSFKCKLLRGIYRHNFRTYPNLWVDSIVILTNPNSDVVGADGYNSSAKNFQQHSFTFASVDDFIKFIRKRAGLCRPEIDNDQVKAIVNYLYKINTPKKDKIITIPGYETIEYTKYDNYIEIIAKPLDRHSRGLSRFRIFAIPDELRDIEKRRFEKIAFQTLMAVSSIGYHQNIHKVWHLPNDDGYIIEGSDWSEAGTLRDLLTSKGKVNSNDVYNIGLGILNGLKEIHKVSVIHRALKPENILMMNGIPKITNFDLSYQYHDNEKEHLTVIADPSKIKDDGYTAPEVLAGKDIDETTDFFSLGVIIYELLTGVKPFASTIEMQAKGGRLTEEHTKQLCQMGIAEELISCLQQVIVFDRNSRLKSIQEIINVFNIKPTCEGKATFNTKLSPGAKFDVYEIIQLIGEGTDTQIYKARTLNSRIVALKMFNREVPYERVDQEFRILSGVNSSYIVKSDRIGHWDEERYFIEMDYIEGESLRAWINRRERPEWTTFQTVTQCLIEAIKTFHNHKDEDGNPEPLLHSDIKPDNILITKDLKAVLIDCGIAGVPRDDIFQGTSGYVPPDYIVGAEMKYSQDGDLFALGVTLWEWLFGEKPYKNPAIGDEPSVLQLHDNNYPPYIMKWLTKAVATLKENRFDSIEEMESAFHGKLDLDIVSSESQAISSDEDISSQDQQHDVHNMQGSRIENVAENGFVKYLNSLTSVSAGNENAIAEAQIGNKYFERIYVENPITGFVYKELKENHRNVILTGNAGDGKTTIAAEICRRITGGFEIVPSELKKAGFVIIKDMSELTEEERVNILEQGVSNDELTFLIISNTGTLLDSASKLNVNGIEVGTIRSQLLKKMESSQPELFLNNRFSLINIGRTDSISTACRILKKMVDCEDWTFCRKCNKDCPIRINIELIKENEEIVLERIELLYRRLYEYGIRLTLRQMTGHLAYAITSGKICCEIQDLPRVALEENLPKMLFINRLFGDDGITVQSEALQLDPVRQIRKLRFGTELEPNFEREIWVKKESPLPIRGQTASEVFNTLMNSLNESGKYGRLQIRRLVYFLGSTEKAVAKQFISVFLNSPFLQDYLDVCRSGESIIPNNQKYYLRKILQVLQEYFTGIRLTNHDWGGRLYITLNRRGSGARTQMVVADFLFDDFNLELKPKTSFTGEKVGDLYLMCRGKVEMKLDLPFLDYVIKRQHGDVTGELSPYYADRIERFKVDLMTYYTNTRYSHVQSLRLLKIGANRSFQVIDISFNNDGGLEVSG